MRGVVAAAVVALAFAAPVHAGTLDRVRQNGVVHCGAAARAGVADAGEAGRIGGLAVDLCRALTIAVLGPSGHTEFHIYDSAHAYDAVRDGSDEVAFLTADAVSEQGLAPVIVPGPPVFVSELTVMTQPGRSGALTGATVCFMAGSPAHQALEAWVTRTGTPIARIGFQELGEMHDAFDAGRCDAMADEATELADFRADEPGRAGAQILPALGVAPVFAATSTADGAWAALAGWAMAAAVQSEPAPNPWRGDPPGLTMAGLRPGWLHDMAAAVGTYPDMISRSVGPGSRLKLPPGPNALWPDGAMLAPGPR